jgi:hypothetical protein
MGVGVGVAVAGGSVGVGVGVAVGGGVGVGGSGVPSLPKKSTSVKLFHAFVLLPWPSRRTWRAITSAIS